MSPVQFDFFQIQDSTGTKGGTNERAATLKVEKDCTLTSWITCFSGTGGSQPEENPVKMMAGRMLSAADSYLSRGIFFPPCAATHP